MHRLLSNQRARQIFTHLPYTLNLVLILLGIFILLAMSVVWIVFEEFTAFTDYTQQWIEFNFFIYYWDKLTISRVYLAFIHIYGGVLLIIGAMQIHGMRKKNLNLLHLAPLLLIFVAVITVLGGICWLIVTAVNYNEGFLATGGFIFERMRFKGNVWKDLIYREQSFRLVTENRVPVKAPILKIWVFQRQRDFSCCGWDSYMDYAKGNYTDLPESCCSRSNRVYGCANNFLYQDRSDVINTRGCRGVMYPWYRAGFIENIVMSIIGLAIGAFQFFAYTVNRKEYYRLLDDIDDMRKPMMNTTMSMSTINSGGRGGPASAGPAQGTGHLINFGPQFRYAQAAAALAANAAAAGTQPHQRLMNQNTPSMGGGDSNLLPQLMGAAIGLDGSAMVADDNDDDASAHYVNPIRNVEQLQSTGGRFSFNRGNSHRQQQPPQQQQQQSYPPNTPSDRVLIGYQE